MEAELKALRHEQAARTRQLDEQEQKLKAREAALTDRDAELEQAAQEQAMERSHLEKLKEEVEGAQVSVQQTLGLLPRLCTSLRARLQHPRLDQAREIISLRSQRVDQEDQVKPKEARHH